MAESLVYYSDDRPGITRKRCGRGFAFYAADGTHIADKAEVSRLKSLAVPPAQAKDPVAMARAMKLAVEAGRLAYGAGRMPRRLYASASSPIDGLANF